MNKPRGKPFEPGNCFGKGRPKGSRNKSTFETQQLLEQYSAPLMRRCIREALRGNLHALRLCIDRLLPIPRDARVRLTLPKVKTIEDIGKAEQAIIRASSAGDVTPADGETLMNLVTSRRKSIETDDLNRRIEELEKAELERAQNEQATEQAKDSESEPN